MTRRLSAGLAPGLALVWLLLPAVPVLLWVGAERWSFPGVLPQEWGVRGWREALDDGLLAGLGRSLALALAVAALATPLGAMAGRALGRRLARRPRLVVSVLLLPLLLPPFAVAMGLDVVVLRLPVPAVVAVVAVLAVLALPYATAAATAGYARCPEALEEQARALGATPRQARRLVVRPAVRPSLVVAFWLAFLVGWSDYVVTLLLGGGRLVTAPVLLGSTAGGTGNEAAVAALALATAVPPVLVLLAVAARPRGLSGGTG